MKLFPFVLFSFENISMEFFMKFVLLLFLLIISSLAYAEVDSGFAKKGEFIVDYTIWDGDSVLGKPSFVVAPNKFASIFIQNKPNVQIETEILEEFPSNIKAEIKEASVMLATSIYMFNDDKKILIASPTMLVEFGKKASIETTISPELRSTLSSDKFKMEVLVFEGTGGNEVQKNLTIE